MKIIPRLLFNLFKYSQSVSHPVKDKIEFTLYLLHLEGKITEQKFSLFIFFVVMDKKIANDLPLLL